MALDYIDAALNYTQLSLTTTQHVHVVGTEIVIFLLILIAFNQMSQLFFSLVRFFFPKKYGGL